MTTFRVLINIFISNQITNISMLVLCWSIFLINHWEKNQKTRLSSKLGGCYREQQYQTSQQPCMTGQITMMRFNEDKCKQSTETKNQIHKYNMIKILSNCLLCKKKMAQTKADSKLNISRYCDIETLNLFLDYNTRSVISK